MDDVVNVINEYVDEEGRSPYAEWLMRLKDIRARAKVILQVDKMELGLFGDGLSELPIHYGPDYRALKKITRSIFCFVVAINRFKARI